MPAKSFSVCAGLALLLLASLLLAAPSAASVTQPKVQPANWRRALRQQDGIGRAGTAWQQLLRDMNILSARAPRLGSSAVISTAADGAEEAQRRTAAVQVSSLPLQTAGEASGGAAAIDPAASSTLLNARASSVAKAIADDEADNETDFGASSRVKGETTTTGRQGLPAGSVTQGTANTASGEKASVSFSTRDGAVANGVASQQGIGDQVETELETAALTATVKTDDGGPTNFGGSYHHALARTSDNEASTTLDLGLPSNTDATLTSSTIANRYGYTRATPTATLRADNTRSGRVRLTSGEAATGFVLGGSNAQSTTFLAG